MKGDNFMTEVSKVGATPANSEVPPLLKAPEQPKVPKPVWQQEVKNDPDKGVTVEKTNVEEQPKADDKNLVKASPHKVNKGFYPATSDTNSKITGPKGILANDGKKIKESSDPAGTVADTVISTKSYTAKSGQMQNQVRQMIIAANPSVFEKDGSLKKNADLGKLDIPTIAHLTANLDKSDPKRTVIPKGFYPAFKDGSGSINGLTESQLRRNQGKEGKETCGAVQVMNALLKTKGGKFITGERKAALLNDLVRKNPSVFDKNGNLKKNADLTKLDVPTASYMTGAYKKIPAKSSPVTVGNNGYYAVGSGKNAKFYMANGTEIMPTEFAKRCPSIYKQIIAR